jgi:hypothetical protein
MKNTSANAVRLTDQSTVLKRIIASCNSALRPVVGGDRFSNLTSALKEELLQLGLDIGHLPSLLDFGCGNMAIGEALEQASCAKLAGCCDVYPPPRDGDPQKWSKYHQLIGDKLRFKSGTFDVSMAIDVLHHAGMKRAITILRELARCSSYVVVKDHFEYGPISRQLLRLADWYGNWAYDVNVPDRYFDTAVWEATISSAGLKEVRRTTGVTIHTGLFGLILPAKLHFISVLTRTDYGQ